MRTFSLALAAVAAATFAPPVVGAADYVYRARPAAIGSASTMVPVVPVIPTPPPPIVEAPRPPVIVLAVAASTTYRTSRPLSAVLAELAPTQSRSIRMSSRNGSRSGTLDWGPTDPTQGFAESFSSLLDAMSFGATASLDGEGRLTLRVQQATANVLLKSDGGIALGAFAFAPMP